MYPCRIFLGDESYICAESAFQAMKCVDPAERLIFSFLDGKSAKRYGRQVKLRSDWEQIKDNVMLEVLKAKFLQNPELLKKLKRTTGIIREDNTWGDTYWGVCNGVGRNKLGELLMIIRDAES
jgi:ribA/ribD-fused uncharacterized protein